MLKYCSIKKLQKRWCALIAGCVLYYPAHLSFAQQIPDTIAQRAAACFACHGKEGRATNEGYFPRIAGKPAGYLYNQLLNFRDGRRQNAQMAYMVAFMSDQYLKELADYFASQHPPYPPSQTPNVSQSALERGHLLATAGDKTRNIPACVSCHGEKLTGVLPSIPSLVGLSRDYLRSQFGSWKIGTRKAAAPDCMAQITRQLTQEDISAVTAWLASQPIPNDMSAMHAGSIKLPIACGIVPNKNNE